MSDAKEKEPIQVLNPHCSCPKIRCRRHGDCTACKRHHRRNMTFCQIKPAKPGELASPLLHAAFHYRRGLGGKLAAIACLRRLFSSKP